MLSPDAVLSSREGLIHPGHIRHGEITPAFIARRLAGINRYMGDTRMTVAQHCVDGERFLLRAGETADARWFYFLHDGGEAISGDWPPQIRAAFPEIDAWCKYAQAAVWQIFTGQEEPEARIRAVVDAMDRQMLATEVRRIYKHNWREQFPAAIKIMPPAGWEKWRGAIPAAQAEAEWLERFGELENEWEAMQYDKR